ncbi:hypothetical protein LCGC14_0499150 [marine sediment metagenome]|uniref:Uncharacterized protein n=1 Tax=marine sediment metagenome TaxID=412755 RepID=A0A0F9URA7_9ZZZZ
MTYRPFVEDSKAAFGELQISELSPVFQNTFEYTVDNTELLTNTVVAGGTVTQANGMGTVGTSTTTASTALMESRQHARYHAGQGGLSRFTALWSAPVEGTEMYVGLADEIGSIAAFENGFMVGYDGVTFGFHRFQNDTKITIALSEWDDPLDGSGPSGMTINTAMLNVFQIQFQYLGAGPIKIFIEDDTNGKFILAHTVSYVNQNTEPSVHNPNFHHIMWVNNGGTTSDMIIRSGSFGFYIEGRTDLIQLHQPQFASGTQQKTSVTDEVAILTIRNKTTYASKTNFIDILIQGLLGAIDANQASNIGVVRIVKNATLGGAPDYSDINSSDSVVEMDTDGTDVTGGQELIGTPLSGQNDKDDRDVTDLKIILNPGDTLTVAGSSGNSATMAGGILWRELF